MIYRQMPAIWNPAFRERFYARWGHESAVISASARRAEYPEFTQLLSIKSAAGGTENYFVDGRRFAVDDDTFLILNAGRRYGSSIDAFLPVHSLSIFFEPGMVDEVAACLNRPTAQLLDEPGATLSKAVEFDERLHEHDAAVTDVMQRIRRGVDLGLDNGAWLDEQLRLLLAAMLGVQRRMRDERQVIPAAKVATRRELHRRIGLGVSFIHSHYRESIGLKDIAAASHLSPFHLQRTFKALYGINPAVALSRKRLKAAVRLMLESNLSLTEIAAGVGFGNRTTLFRHLHTLPAAQRDTLAARRVRKPRND